MTTPPIESDGVTKNVDDIEDELKNSDRQENKPHIQNNEELKDALQNDDGTKNEPENATVSDEPLTTDTATSLDSFVSASITLYVLRHAKPNHSWKIQALFDGNIKFEFENNNARNLQEVC
jgi:hypothetical protein